MAQPSFMCILFFFFHARNLFLFFADVIFLHLAHGRKLFCSSKFSWMSDFCHKVNLKSLLMQCLICCFFGVFFLFFCKNWGNKFHTKVSRFAVYKFFIFFLFVSYQRIQHSNSAFMVMILLNNNWDLCSEVFCFFFNFWAVSFVNEYGFAICWKATVSLQCIDGFTRVSGFPICWPIWWKIGNFLKTKIKIQ